MRSPEVGVSPSDRAGVSRRRFLQLAGVTGAGLLIPVQAFATSEATGQSVDGDGIVLRWNNAALQGVRDSKLGPPMVARALLWSTRPCTTPGRLTIAGR